MATKKVSRAKNAGRIVHTLAEAVHHPGILLLPEAAEYVSEIFFTRAGAQAESIVGHVAVLASVDATWMSVLCRSRLGGNHEQIICSASR